MIIYLVDPAYIDRDNFIDRAEDFGTFFTKFAYNEYSQTQSFEKTVSDIQLFCKGYDYTSSFNGVKFSDYYPTEKTTIDFHIALGILIESVFKSRLERYSSNDSVVLTSLEATKYILKKQPFCDF